ncbi:MAG: S46 family peptidase [Candidatus Solibacter usitatus]|nr:S46 family peptidase [Candidatus Solibacter usitatus]
MRLSYQLRAAAVLAVVWAGPARADEGMWLFSNFPVRTVSQQYGFQVSSEFLDHLRTSAVRFNNGGTGSFISGEGLLFTNHHVGADCIQKLGSAKADYLKDGFVAKAMEEERRCPDLEVNVLLRTEDVTARVTAGVRAETPAAEANQMKKAAMSGIEKECGQATGNRCDVVALYAGGQYHLYQYKKYTDIRLVMAPEFRVAFFGGDPENFTFPRYNLDITFFRAYEGGKPARVEHYFKWAKAGVKEGDLVFVPGNPGSTGRLMTVTQLEFAGRLSYPLVHRRLSAQIQSLRKYMDKGEEQRRIGQENLFGAQNSYKAYSGFLRGLRDKELMEQKRRDERKLRDAIGQDAAKAEKFGTLWDELAAAYGSYEGFHAPYYLLESGATRGSELFQIARDVVRYAEETRKPDKDRLREYAEAALPSLEQTMYSTAPIHNSLEIAILEDYFNFAGRELGFSHPAVAAMLDGMRPDEAAKHYVETSKLADVSERKRLAGDLEAVKTSKDGMIRLALAVDQHARHLRKRYEDQVESVVTRAAGSIAQARFSVFGGDEYPDATFTLRLAYGAVRGYQDEAGRAVPFATETAGLYAKVTDQEPYTLPASWLKAKSALGPSTHFNFVTTADTHGGNSGSATLNTRGEVVGILFDGNLESLPNRFVYSDKRARSVHVASEAIVETLKKVYKADKLVKELGF